MITHDIYLDSYAQLTRPLMFGTQGSYGVEQIHVIPSGPWVDAVITAIFSRDDSSTRVLLSTDNTATVPADATAAPTTAIDKGCLILEGVAPDMRIYTVNIPFRVLGHGPAYGGEPVPPTPSEVEQILYAVKDAREIAQSIRDDADAGKFDGKDYVITQQDYNDIAGIVDIKIDDHRKSALQEITDAKDLAVDEVDAHASYAREAADDAAESAKAALRAAMSMSYVSFMTDILGHVILQNSQLLGTSAFKINQSGHMEVHI